MSSSTTSPTISSTSPLSTLRPSTSTSPTTTNPSLPSISCDVATSEYSPFPDTKLPYAVYGGLSLDKGWSECCNYGSPAFFYNGCSEICIFSNFTGTLEQAYNAFIDCLIPARPSGNGTGDLFDGVGLFNSAPASGVAHSSATIGLVVVLASLWGLL